MNRQTWINGNVIATAHAANDTNNTVVAGNSILSAIQGLQATAAQQLTLLNAQLNAASQNVVTGQTFTGVNGTVISSGATVNNNMLQALNKIVYNTKLIVDNTSYSASWGTGSTHSGHPDNVGIFAQGGTIPPYGVGLVSEHLNPTFLRAGPEPIHVFPGAPSNDNSATVAELRRLNEKFDRLERVVAGSGANVARAVIEGTDKVADKVDDQTDILAAQERQSSRQRKVA
jgi:hypothetical protein